MAFIIIALVVIIVLLLGKDKDDSPRTQTDYNTVSDGSTGLSFNMSKKFAPIPRNELAAMNPGFTYGYRPANDPDASCIVSQSPLVTSGTLPSPARLRAGLFREVKKVHPDVRLGNPQTASKPVRFGKAAGVLLELHYSEGVRKIKRVEVIAVGKSTQVIAYCQSLARDSQRYYDDFTIFFSSLSLK